MQLKQAVKPKSQKSSTQKVYFEYYAPSAQSVCLTGTFNQKKRKTADGRHGWNLRRGVMSICLLWTDLGNAILNRKNVCRTLLVLGIAF